MSQQNSATAASAAITDIGELYREIFARSIDGIAIIDRAGHYVEQNAAHEDLTGYSDADLAGQTPAIHLGEEGFAEIADALQQHGWYRGRLDSRGKSGNVKKIDLAAFPVLDNSGKPAFFVGIKRDITEHERLAEERDARLRELECLYGLTRALNRAHALEEIYDVAIEALFTAVAADRASILTYEMEDRMHFRAWRGLSEEYRKAVDGHSPWQRSERNATSIAVADVFADSGLAAYAPIFEKEGIRSLAFIPIAFEGQLLGKFMIYYNQVHEFTSEEIHMAEAVATQIAVVVQRRQGDEALRRSEKLATAGKLAATVAHEINNPLEAVTNLVYLAQRDLRSKPDEVERYLALASRELDRVAHIARQTLGFYRDRSSPAKFSVTRAIDDLIYLFEKRFETRNIEVCKEYDQELVITGLSGEIRQALSNLITNAIDAMPNGGKFVVRARTSQAGHNSQRPGVRISVLDTGAGIAPRHLANLFQPFFSTKQDVGTGLGLWVTRTIVEKHHGTIRVRTRTGRVNHGTVFSMFLPRDGISNPAEVSTTTPEELSA